MDAILAPWIARADYVCPQWRSIVHDRPQGELDAPYGRDSISLLASNASMTELELMFSNKRVLSAAEQLELREVLEILALALSIDSRRCMELACEGKGYMKPQRGVPLEINERLRVTLDAQLTPWSAGDMYKPFFADWREETASDLFKESKGALVELLGRRRRGHFLDLSLTLTLRSSNNYHDTMPLAPMIQLLENINRDVFRVTQIALSIRHSVFHVDELTEFFRLLHGFRDDAHIRIYLRLCQDKERTVNFRAWKPLLDLIARKTFSTTTNSSDETRKNDWAIVVSCGDPSPLDESDDVRDRLQICTDARLVAACFSAFAHAGDHVTSVSLLNPLKDKIGGVQEQTDRDTRAQWLGYLLRCGVVEKLAINEGAMTMDDLDIIASILEAPTRADCFRQLWKSSWSQSSEEQDETMYELVEDPEQYLTDTQEVLGLMNEEIEDEEESRPHVDVFLVGYGQCSVSSAHTAVLEAMKQATALVPEKMAQLKSLSIQTDNNYGDLHGLLGRQLTPPLRLLSLVGQPLEELTITSTYTRLRLPSFLKILTLCPNLRRLEVNNLQLAETDDEQEPPAMPSRRHPLKVLKLHLRLNEQSSGVRALSQWLVWFGIELQELGIEAKGAHHPVGEGALPAIEAMVQTCCRSCERIELSKFEVHCFRDIFTQERVAFPLLRTLVFNDAIWTRESLSGLLSALSSTTHSLARSLYSLDIRNSGLQELEYASISAMLEKNRWLVNFRCVVWDSTRMGETNGITLKRIKTPLTLRQKMAFLSVLEATRLPWESFAVANIFRFAPDPEIRRVII